MSNLNALAKEIHKTACEHGWWGDLSDYREGEERPNTRNFGEVLMLVVSEAAEALEEYRNGHLLTEVYFPQAGVHGPHADSPLEAMNWAKMYGWKPEGVPTELADIIIRVLDAAAAFGIDLDAALGLKMAYNETRPFRHGGKRA